MGAQRPSLGASHDCCNAVGADGDRSAIGLWGTAEPVYRARPRGHAEAWRTRSCRMVAGAPLRLNGHRRTPPALAIPPKITVGAALTSAIASSSDHRGITNRHLSSRATFTPTLWHF
jgi:hypothetical protein